MQWAVLLVCSSAVAQWAVDSSLSSLPKGICSLPTLAEMDMLAHLELSEEFHAPKYDQFRLLIQVIHAHFS